MLGVGSLVARGPPRLAPRVCRALQAPDRVQGLARRQGGLLQEKGAFLGVYRHLHGPAKVQEHTTEAMYPPLPPEHQEDFHSSKDFMKNLQTVEEKMYQINRPKHFGWYSFMLEQDYLPFGGLDWLQFVTQTHVVAGLPECQVGEETSTSATHALAPTIPPTPAPTILPPTPAPTIPPPPQDTTNIDKLVEELAPRVEEAILNDHLYTVHGFEEPNDR